MTKTNSSDRSAEAEGLSDYERIRAHNIERNNARLRELGLISKKEEVRSNDIAWGRKQIAHHHDNNDSSEGPSGSEYEDDGSEAGEEDEGWEDPRRPHGDAIQLVPCVIKPKKKKNKSKKRKADGPPAEGSRKSRRLQGIGADGAMIEPPPSKEQILKERVERVKECREVRLRAARAVAAAGAEKAAKENPTATYEHCLMRCKTMSEKGLKSRVKAIERAAGKHCVVKMAIFKSCLQDEGMWELAELASESLERLKGMKPPE